jgi:hypothetical protein
MSKKRKDHSIIENYDFAIFLGMDKLYNYSSHNYPIFNEEAIISEPDLYSIEKEFKKKTKSYLRCNFIKTYALYRSHARVFLSNHDNLKKKYKEFKNIVRINPMLNYRPFSCELYHNYDYKKLGFTNQQTKLMFIHKQKKNESIERNGMYISGLDQEFKDFNKLKKKGLNIKQINSLNKTKHIPKVNNFLNMLQYKKKIDTRKIKKWNLMSFEPYSSGDPYESFGCIEKYYCRNKKKWIETDKLDYAIKPSNIKYYVNKDIYDEYESGYSSPNDYYSPNRNPYFDDDNWDQREHDRDEELRRQD